MLLVVLVSVSVSVLVLALALLLVLLVLVLVLILGMSVVSVFTPVAWGSLLLLFTICCFDVRALPRPSDRRGTDCRSA